MPYVMGVSILSWNEKTLTSGNINGFENENRKWMVDHLEEIEEQLYTVLWIKNDNMGNYVISVLSSTIFTRPSTLLPLSYCLKS